MPAERNTSGALAVLKSKTFCRTTKGILAHTIKFHRTLFDLIID